MSIKLNNLIMNLGMGDSLPLEQGPSSAYLGSEIWCRPDYLGSDLCLDKRPPAVKRMVESRSFFLHFMSKLFQFKLVWLVLHPSVKEVFNIIY